MNKTLVGVAVAIAAAAGGAVWAVKRLFGTAGHDEASEPGAYGSTETAPPPHREGLDPTLLEILACPDDKQPVIYQREAGDERLTCTKCGKRYPVRDGIPVMLIDEAMPGPPPSEEEVAAARALIPEGKPAIVGAESSPSKPIDAESRVTDSTPAERVVEGKSLDAASAE